MVENDEIKMAKISIKLFVLFVLYFKTSRCYYSEFVLYNILQFNKKILTLITTYSRFSNDH